MSYFTDYIFYSSENEASIKYHKWGCLVSLSYAVTRKVWIQQGDWRVYPNIFVGFVGDPASGKSTALKFTEKLVQAFTEHPICPAAITREALTLMLAKECNASYMWEGQSIEYSPLAIFSSEFTTWLGAEPQRMIEIMTDLYDPHDGMFKIATKNKGTDEINRPCLTLLACITPTYLDSMLTQKLISGGFTRRIIPVYARERGSPKAFPKFDEHHQAAKFRCVAYAKQLARLVGPFIWDDDAHEWFQDWYDNIKTPAMRDEVNDVMKRYYTAKDNLLIKVAMLISLSEQPELRLTLKSLLEAEDWLVEIEPDILTIFGGGGRNELASIKCAIERFIHASGLEGTSISRLKKIFFAQVKDKELLEVLNHLVDINTIIRQGRITQVGQVHLQIDQYVHRDHLPHVPSPPQ